MSTGLIVVVLAMLLGVQPVTTDLYLPGLPFLAEELGASMSQAQLTLSALLLAFGISQLIWGPLSDRFGRRPILLWGLAAYTLAAVASTFSGSMAQLIAWRVVQGAAMGAASMCARAIVRDLYEPAEGARVMSKGLTIFGVLVCLCAPIGGLLSDLYGWRMVLLAPAFFGALALAFIALRFQESVTTGNADALRPRVLFETWLSILRNPAFLAFTALSVASFAALFTFLALSSFVAIKTLGLSRSQYGMLMLIQSATYIAGTFICRRLLRRFGMSRSVMIASLVSAGGGTMMGVLGLAGIQAPWAIFVPQMIFMLAHGVNQPCSQTGSVGPFPRAAGAASAMNGFLMMATAFGIGGWMGAHPGDTAAALTNGVWLWSVVLAITAWTVVRKYGEPVRR